MMPTAELRNEIVQPPFEFLFIRPELDIPTDAHGPSRHWREARCNVAVDAFAVRPIVATGQFREIAGITLAPHPEMHPSAAFRPFGRHGFECGESADIRCRRRGADTFV